MNNEITARCAECGSTLARSATPETAEEAFARGIEAAAKVADGYAQECDAAADRYRPGSDLNHHYITRAEGYRNHAAAVRALAKGETR